LFPVGKRLVDGELLAEGVMAPCCRQVEALDPCKITDPAFWSPLHGVSPEFGAPRPRWRTVCSGGCLALLGVERRKNGTSPGPARIDGACLKLAVPGNRRCSPQARHVQIKFGEDRMILFTVTVIEKHDDVHHRLPDPARGGNVMVKRRPAGDGLVKMLTDASDQTPTSCCELLFDDLRQPQALDGRRARSISKLRVPPWVQGSIARNGL